MEGRKKKETVVVRMDRETAQVVMKAAEFYARVLCGQFEEVSDGVHKARMAKTFKEEGREAMHEALDESLRQCNSAEPALMEARRILFPELDLMAHHGLGWSEETDLAFSAYMAVRHALAWHDHPEGGWTVNFDEPWPVEGHELTKVEIMEADDEAEAGKKRG